MKKLIVLLASLLFIFTAVLSPRAAVNPDKKDMLKHGNPEIKVGKTGTPEWAAGVLSESLSKDFNGAAKFMEDNKDIFLVENAQEEFEVLQEKDDELGYKHIKLQQKVNGIPVFGNEYYIHFDAEGKVYVVNGSYDPSVRNTKIDKHFINKKQAEEAAEKEVVFEELEEDITSKLYLYKVSEEYLPVYLVRISFLYPEPGNWMIFVNAYDGSIVDKYNNIMTEQGGADKGKPAKPPTGGTAATATGRGVLGDNKTINVTLSGGIYYLQDITNPMYSRGGEIITYDANNQTRLPGTMMSDTDTVFDSTRHPAAIDAHYYADMVYDYYYNNHGRNSLDNNAMDIKSTVHYGRNYSNAFWSGSQMVYGDGDGVNYRPFSASLDVIAHEMTHGVTDKEAGLIYRDQSGALSESFSDIFGCMIESKNYIMGEDCCIKEQGFRSVDNPNQFGDPDHMNEYVYTSLDNGGVHTNCGIPNKAGSIILKGLGFDKAGKIYYRAVVQYLTSSTNFSQAKAALMQSAADLYGANGTEYNSVKNAFDSVGIQ